MVGVAAGAELRKGQVTVAGRAADYVLRPAEVARPLLVVLAASGDPLPAEVQKRDWNILVPQVPLVGDWGVKVLEAMVAEASKTPTVLIDHTYLAASTDFAWMAFYAASRAPWVFTATLAAGGTPKPAIDTNRLFGGNTQATPVLWVIPAKSGRVLNMYRQRLEVSGFQVRTAASLGDAMDILAGLQRDEYPATVDCETGHTAFARCFWAEITQFDVSKRNDALNSTRVYAGSGASLDIGPFGYDAAAPGPGVTVAWLPPDYKGPLQLQDKIVALNGKPMADGMAYVLAMDDFREDREVSVMIERGKDRKRLDTKVTLPKREEGFTARVQGQYLADSKEVLLVTRGVGGLRVHVPPQWAGATLNWNGEVSEPVKEGCWVLAAGAKAQPCAAAVK